MSRRNVVWLITLPLAIVGSQVAHATGYRLATGEGELAHALASSGHGYLAYAPLALGVCAAFVVLALVRELVGALGGDARASRPSALVFSILAPAIFVAQEHFERLAHDGVFPTSLLVEKTFLLRARAPGAVRARRVRAGAATAAGDPRGCPTARFAPCRRAAPAVALAARRSLVSLRSRNRPPVRPTRAAFRSRRLIPAGGGPGRAACFDEHGRRSASPEHHGTCPGALVVVAAIAACALVAPSAASAHASLVGTAPANDAVLDRPPERVVLRFDEAVSTVPGSIRVFDEQVERVDSGDVTKPTDDSVSVGPPRRLGQRHVRRRVAGHLRRLASDSRRVRLLRGRRARR